MVAVARWAQQTQQPSLSSCSTDKISIGREIILIMYLFFLSGI
jgi:hypothetical protein